jgi:hypothetical protein
VIAWRATTRDINPRLEVEMRPMNEASRCATTLRARADTCFLVAKSFPPSAAADVTEAMGRAYARLADRIEKGEVPPTHSEKAPARRADPAKVRNDGRC